MRKAYIVVNLDFHIDPASCFVLRLDVENALLVTLHSGQVEGIADFKLNNQLMPLLCKDRIDEVNEDARCAKIVVT